MKTMKFGTVRCYDALTGEGAITPNGGGGEIRVSRDAVARARLGQLCAGQTLGYALAHGTRDATDLWATWSNR